MNLHLKCNKVREESMIFKNVSLFIFNASSALLCTIWSWWSKCQNTIRKVVFVVFPVQPESESTRNLLRKAVFIGHKAQFVNPKSLKRKVAEIKLSSRFKYWAKRGQSGFGVYQISFTVKKKKKTRYTLPTPHRCIPFPYKLQFPLYSLICLSLFCL